MNKWCRLIVMFLAGAVLVTSFSGVLDTGYAADLVVAPDKTLLSPALIKEPITLNGSGWGPNEMVVIDMVLPKGIAVKGVKEGEDVGIAFANADANGNFKTAVSPTAILMTFLQVDWNDAEMKPDFQKATPLPPGTYVIQASGLDSQLRAKATLELLQPKKD